MFTYLLLHRAMSLLPPTMIPNIEPTDEEEMMQDLIDYHLPQPRHYIEAPVPDSVPTPPKFSFEPTSTSKKRTAKGTPKAPALPLSGLMKTRNSSGHSKRTRSRATPGRSSLANLGSLSRTSRSCGIISRTAWARSSPTRSFDARLVQREKGYPLGPLGFSSLNLLGLLGPLPYLCIPLQFLAFLRAP